MRRRWMLAAIMLAVIVTAALCMTFLRNRGSRGGTPGLADRVRTAIGQSAHEMQQWIGRQLLAIANDYLRPELTFERLDYRAPGTVTLTGVKLVDGAVAFVEARSLEIEFAEVPEVGRPIVIKRISLVEPVVRLIQKDDGSFVGFSALLSPAEGAASQDGGSTRLSDVFALELIRISDGTFEYERPSEPAMKFDHITLDLTSRPQVGDPGWYGINGQLSTDPVFRLALDAELNLDTAAMKLRRADLLIDLEPTQYQLLPPQLQVLLQEHEVRGRLEAHATGDLRLKDPATSRLQLDGTLTDGYVAFGEYKLPVNRLGLIGGASEGVLTLEQVTIDALGGAARLAGTIPLVSGGMTTWSVSGRDLRLERILRDEGPNPRYAGRMTFDGRGDMFLGAIPETLRGDARVEISEARLVNVPVIGGLLEFIGSAPVIGEFDDRGSAQVALGDKMARLTDVDIVSAAIAARGEGEIRFDSSVNFRFNAGPLERVQGLLGTPGKWFGAVTDKLVVYQVTGTLQNPTIATRLLGLGVEEPSR